MTTSRPQGPICQSCTMPMGKPEDFGTNADGSRNKDYCAHCFQKGKFTEPNITMKEITEKVAGMMKSMKMPAAQIEQAKAAIPTLKRWSKK